MRNLACIALLIAALSSPVQAEENEKEIKSKITGVTVFMQGAQITRSGTTTLPKGTSVVVFNDISPYINSQSIKASGKGRYTIMDVQYRYVYPEPVQQDTKETDRIQRKIDQLTDSLTEVGIKLANVRGKKQAIEIERNVLVNHPLLKGTGKPDSLQLLIGTLTFMEDRLKAIADRYMAISLKENKVLQEQQDMNTRLYALRQFMNNRPAPKRDSPKHQVLVAVTCDVATTASLEINYKVNQAGWSPWYDITAKDAGDDIELIYKAAVYQNTGVDWKGVKIRISNANPNQSNIKPVLPKWYIDYYRKVVRAQDKKKSQRYFSERSSASVAVEDDIEADMEVVEEKDAGMAYDFSQKMQNFSSIEFDISLPYNITSNGKPHFVTVQKHNLKAQFQHYLVPKLDKDAFVVARITDWENLDLLVGSANIYFGNTFIGRTVIDPSIVSDTLEVSMGRYRSLAVKRTKLKDETKKQIVGPNKVYTATYTIELRNNSANPISLTLEDQVPLTRNQEIEIELVKADGGKLNDVTGLITWDMELAPYKKKKITFTYTVKYPKEQEITGI